jgi:F0F1-type ATP synthase alpha subunit
MICAVTEGYAAKVSPADMGRFQSELFECFESEHTDLLKKIGSKEKPSSADMAAIREAIKAFAEEY